jgi:exodeoxyribonuclease V alpha subunit
MESVSGKVTNVVFSNKNTGFHVLKLSLTDGNVIRVAGVFPNTNISTGLKATFQGRFENHPTYGNQLTASVCEITAEKNKSGITSYLTAHVPSIGPITALRIYDVFGDDTIELLNKDPSIINTLPFLTKNQAAAIIAEWSTANSLRDNTIYLSSMGLSSSQIKGALTYFKTDIREVLSVDPYKLCEVPGVGFSTADVVARKLGIGVDDIKRVKGLILYTISELCSNEGHIFVSSKQIFDYSSKRIFKNNVEPFSHGDYISESHFYPALSELVADSKLVVVDDCIYLSHQFKYEAGIASALSSILVSPALKIDGLWDIITNFERRHDIKLSDEQKDALLMLTKSRGCVVTGFPGTGKTTIISAFVHVFEECKLNYVLLSPTGIAAKRLSQVTNRPASTIHRALGYKKDGTWEFHSGNKYCVDAIIIDEMSMVDSATFFSLVSAILPTTQIIMVGDPAQLPSVNSGSVLSNVSSTKVLPHVSLTKIYRQGKTSDIITVAHSILKSEDLTFGFDKDSEFIVLPMAQSDVLSEIKKLCVRLRDLKKNFQVIAPMYDGSLGVNSLNLELRSVLNSVPSDQRKTYIKNVDVGLCEGDRVMVIKNDYERCIYNGDVGKIHSIDLKSDQVEVKIFNWIDNSSTGSKFSDHIFTFTVDEAKSMLRVAYACTAHKVQGQEFDYVVMPMTNQYGAMLYKNLIYTAITRARKKVFVIGDVSALNRGISSVRDLHRNSNLSKFIDSSYDTAVVKQITKS